jgi:hypothetical protein
MTVLHLGVYDQPYSVNVALRRQITKTYKSGETHSYTMPAPGAETTVDVATWLEAKYHVMEVFYHLYEKPIGEAFIQGLEGAVESMMMGGPPTINPYGTATNYIQDWFRRYLTEGQPTQAESQGTPGVPTKRALSGISSRFKKGVRSDVQGKRRPSFVDTGLYENSFVAWVDDDAPTGANPRPRPKTVPPIPAP